MLKKTEAMEIIKDYLIAKKIGFETVNESKELLLVEDVDCIVIPRFVDKVIGQGIEIQLRFRDNHLYLMAFYSQVFCSKEKYDLICRFLNYINTYLCYDIILDFNMALDEETGDIYDGVMIRYETLDSYFEEVLDYILNFQKQLLEDICYPLVMLQDGRWDLPAAQKHIKCL